MLLLFQVSARMNSIQSVRCCGIRKASDHDRCATINGFRARNITCGDIINVNPHRNNLVLQKGNLHLLLV